MSIKMQLINNLKKYFPFLYILLKSDNFSQGILNIKGYNSIKKNNFFDKEFYLNQNKDLKDFDIDFLAHYLIFGFKEGKDPNKDFDGVFYINEYEDAKKSNLNPLVHYALFGIKKDFKTHADLSLNLESFVDIKKKRILFLLHEKIGTFGGTGFNSLDLIESIKDNYQVFILTSKNSKLDLWQYSTNLSKLGQWNIDFKDSESKNIYLNILKSLKINLIHINHVINHDYSVFEIANSLNIPYIINLHDFYYLCPSIHLLDSNQEFCNLDCNKFNCKIIQKKDDIQFLNQWRKKWLEILNKSYINIAPSNSLIKIYKNVFKNFENYKIIEHGINTENFKYKNNFSFPDSFPVKIVFPGHISPHKGSLFIKEIKKLDKDNKLDFYFMGTTIPLLKEYGHYLGRYDRDDFSKIISKIKPSFIGIFSICPEAYSYTLSESWASGIPVIATKLGALKERIENNSGGWLIDYKDSQKAYEEIIKIINDKEGYRHISENISKIKINNIEVMSNKYKEIYKEVLDE